MVKVARQYHAWCHHHNDGSDNIASDRAPAVAHSRGERQGFKFTLSLVVVELGTPNDVILHYSYYSGKMYYERTYFITYYGVSRSCTRAAGQTRTRTVST